MTDLDATFFDTVEIATDSVALAKKKRKARGSRDSGIARQVILDAFCSGNNWIQPFYAPHTFEVDFINSNNKEPFINIINSVYIDPPTRDSSKTEIESSDISLFGQRALTMANYSGKGWFSILLGNALDHSATHPRVYIKCSVFCSWTR